jgi:pimeloyl-ACP methyl ester carboxylesterase
MPVAEFTARVRESNRSWGPDEEALEIILANFEISADERITPRLSFENHMQIVRAMWEFKTHERLRRLRCPAMAVLAEPFEPLSPPELEMLEAKRNSAVQAQAALPGLEVHWLAETAHDIPLQRPAELAGLILRFAAGPADARP